MQRDFSLKACDGAEISRRRSRTDAERFLSAQADLFAGTKRGEKAGLLRSE
jgi:hypothetical protein